MSVFGMIVEYNPFHNGHLYHFNTSLNITQAEYSVCVMSGNFVQRGEPAIVDKWSRALMALKAGIDLVIELPAIYCVQSAEIFAYGSVSILNKLGIIDNLCFGSEVGDIEILKKIAYVINTEPPMYREYIKNEMKNGKSFAVSRANALIDYLSFNEREIIDSENMKNILLSSNNILGIEYIKWLQRLNSSIVPKTIKRIHSKYNDESLNSIFASATAVRKSIKDGNLANLHEFIPEYTLEILKNQFEKGKGPVFIEDFNQAIICNLRRMPLEDISNIMDVNEGLENKIKKAAVRSVTIEELISNIKSKRYAETRIRRILAHSLLGLYKKDLSFFKNDGGPKYIRVLGFSPKGRNLISMIKSSCPLPIITNVGDYKKYNDESLKKMIELDIQTSDIYVTAYLNRSLRVGGCDYYNKPVMI